VKAVLEAAVTLLTVLVAVLMAVIIAIRIGIRRRYRLERRYRPGAELGIAEYLAGLPRVPEAGGRSERAVLLAVALEALGDLRGSERERLAELIDRLGYTAEAMAGLRARRRARRRQSAAILAAVASASATHALTAALDDTDPIVRTACARTLAEVGGADAATAAIIAVAKRDIRAVPGAVAAVVLALGIAQPSALAPLIGASDAPPEVRSIAIEVAGRLRLSEHAKLLRACQREQDEIAAGAASGLGMIGDVRSVDALMDLAGDDRRALPARAAAVAALGSIGAAPAVPLLESLLGADWPLMAAAVRALCRLGDPGTAALRSAAASSRPEASAMAEAALEP